MFTNCTVNITDVHLYVVLIVITCSIVYKHKSITIEKLGPDTKSKVQVQVQVKLGISHSILTKVET